MKKIVKVLGISAALAAAMAITATAATISTVRFYCTTPEDEEIASGFSTPHFYSDEEESYELASYNDVNEDSTNYKNPHTYELIFYARGGDTFASGSSVNVIGTGITEVVRKKTEEDGGTLVVRVKAYPYFQLNAPDITSTDYTGARITWDKNGSSSFEYVLTYTDQRGEDHVKHGTSTGTSLSISSYNKKYTGKNEDYQDAEVTGFAIRATAASSSNPHVAPSPWVGDTGIVDEVDTKDYEYWTDMGTSTGSGTTVTSGPGVSGGSTPSSASNASNAKNGWVGSGNVWYWYVNGQMMKDYWVQDGGEWYWIGSDGVMKSGWQWDGSGWYYMNEQHDGTFGRMMSGWLNYGGKVYYLNTIHDGTFGKMLTGTHVIDGLTYVFGADGARM